MSSEQKEDERAPAIVNRDIIESRQFLNLSTPLLNSKLQTLQSESQSLASALTAKLASSPSGQSLLHLGPSLSTLPPDLHSLLSALDPLQNAVADHLRKQQLELVRIVTCGKVIEREVRRGRQAIQCKEWLDHLQAAERIIKDRGERKDGGEEEEKDALGTYLVITVQSSWVFSKLLFLMLCV